LNSEPSDQQTTYTAVEISNACQGELHPEALHGLHLFNAGAYFEAHEALENAWRAEQGPVRDLYRGILQVGVAYYHILRGNYPGARKMFQRCRQWLDPFPAVCRGVDVDGLRTDYNAVEQLLIRFGPSRISLIGRSHFKPISFLDKSEDTVRE